MRKKARARKSNTVHQKSSKGELEPLCEYMKTFHGTQKHRFKEADFFLSDEDFFFFKFIYFEKERVHEQGRGRDRVRESQADCPQPAHIPTQGSNP